RHEGAPPNVRALTHYGRLLHEARTDAGVVFDRFARGERVYGPLLRGNDNLGADGWRVFMRLVNAAGARQVLCLPPLGACLEAFAASGGARGLVRDPALMRAQYVAWREQAAAPDWTDVHVYDWTRPDAARALDAYLATSRSTLSTSIVGSPTASVLFVGDQVGPGDGPDVAFLATWGSSAYLTWTLDVAGIPESAVAFVNARGRAGAWTTIPTTNAAGIPWRVVALGRVAEAACRAQNIDHRAAPHPQHRRRFHHSNIKEYARLLREAIA
ncbi:MAG: hypothetical protein AABY22_23185, partial [Nanoarchaeota archaeon]